MNRTAVCSLARPTASLPPQTTRDKRWGGRGRRGIREGVGRGGRGVRGSIREGVRGGVRGVEGVLERGLEEGIQWVLERVGVCITKGIRE